MPKTPKLSISGKSATKRLVVLDAHAIIHRAYHALPDFMSSKGQPTGALYGLSTMLIKIINDLKPEYIAACFDMPGPTFRHEAYEAYKGTRAKAEDDLIWQLQHARDIFDAFGIPYYEKSGFEADDLLGTIVEQLRPQLDRREIEIVIASGDMDTLQLIDDAKVQVYTLKKGINDTILYDEKAVLRRFAFTPALLPDYKGLVGDPSDNIIGIKGIGAKTATTLIRAFGSIETIYAKLKKNPKLFEEKGIKGRTFALLADGEEEALFSKMLATIRRDAPIIFSLPAPWRELCNPQSVEKVFQEFEFRTLFARVKKLLGLPEEVGKQSELEAPPSPDEIEKVGIALWIVDSNITNPSYDDILSFAHTETFSTAKEYIFSQLAKGDLEKVYRDIELPLIPILRHARERGILIDTMILQDLSKKYHEKVAVIERAIFKEAGHEFNINSPRQLGDVLFDELKLTAKGLKKTEGGARSTRESELAKLSGSHPIIDHILAHREVGKLLSTYIDTIPQMVDGGSRLHTTLVQSGAATGRMASINPNLQNIPIKSEDGKKIRTAFIASPGHMLVSLDYSQIEMRVLALLSGDAYLTKVFKEGKDVHAMVASRVFGVDESLVTYDQRRRAKVINFGVIYGMGVTSLQANLGSTRQEAQEFYDSYFAAFPTISTYFERVIKEAAQKGYTETLFGRRRYFQGIHSSIPYIRAAAERMAMNAPIQGTATGDIIKIAIIRADHKLKAEKLIEHAHLLLQVHDELIYEIEEESIDQAVPHIKEEMETVIDPAKVPLTVDIAIGKNWGEL